MILVRSLLVVRRYISVSAKDRRTAAQEEKILADDLARFMQ